MGTISPTNSGTVSATRTNQTTNPEASAPGAPQARDGQSADAADVKLYKAEGGPAKAADIPETPAGSGGTGQVVLDKAFSKMAELEKELDTIDPTTPEGAKRMAQITRDLNRIDEMIRTVNEIRHSRHEANMATIDNIS
jgi:hypothetical protein